MIRMAELQIGDEERAAVMAVLDSGQLAAGPVTKRFEETFAREVSHTREAVAVSNGTAALHLALLAHGVGPGDEVVTTPYTFQATGNMVLATGARPVFVDVRDDGNIDASQVEARDHAAYEGAAAGAPVRAAVRRRDAEQHRGTAPHCADRRRGAGTRRGSCAAGAPAASAPAASRSTRRRT